MVAIRRPTTGRNLRDRITTPGKYTINPAILTGNEPVHVHANTTLESQSLPKRHMPAAVLARNSGWQIFAYRVKNLRPARGNSS
jgi:hypothetical protein